MSEVRQIWIPGPSGKLEAMLRVADCPVAGAVVAHPHPSHGGTMHNPVVFHVERELHHLGWTTLRFNFRSADVHEGAEEVAAAVAWHRGLLSGNPLYLAGYSFGSLCSLRFLQDHPHTCVAGLVAIGLPVREYDLGKPETIAIPLGVAQGTDDEFGSPAEVRQALANLPEPPAIEEIEGATHLFPKQAADAAAAVVRAMARIGAPVPDRT